MELLNEDNQIFKLKDGRYFRIGNGIFGCAVEEYFDSNNKDKNILSLTKVTTNKINIFKTYELSIKYLERLDGTL